MKEKENGFNKAELEKILKNLLHQESKEGLVIAINGSWGTGKTYFWNKFIEKNNSTSSLETCQKKTPEDKKAVYISLFGKDNLINIENDLYFHIASTITKNIKKILTPFKDLGNHGLNIGTLLNLIPKSQHINKIICFDDIERRSNNIDIKDIMGLISRLKEEHKSKVVLIFNSEKIEKDKTIFDDYKEKIIDYEFQYAPTPKECFDSVKNELTCFKGFPLENYIVEKRINNIRVIKRIINGLNTFAGHEELIKKNVYFQEEFLTYLIRVLAIKAMNTIPMSQESLQRLEKYSLKQASEQTEEEPSFSPTTSTQTSKIPKLDTAYKDAVFYFSKKSLGFGDIFLLNDYINFAVDFSETGYIDIDYLEELIKEHNITEEQEDIRESFKKINRDNTYDLSHSINKTVEELHTLIKDKKNKILLFEDSVLHLHNLIYYTKILEELNPVSSHEYHTLAVDIIKNAWKEQSSSIKSIHHITGFNDNLKQFDETLFQELNTERKNINTIKLTSAETVTQQLLQYGGQIPENSPLKMLKIEIIESYLKTSSEFVKEICKNPIDNTGDRKPDPDNPNKVFVTNGFMHKVFKALQNLKQTDNKTHSYKAEKILKILKTRN